MTALRDNITFTGNRFEIITVGQLRAAPGDIIAQVGFGKTFLITKGGKPAAVLSQPPGDTLTRVIDRHGKTSYIP